MLEGFQPTRAALVLIDGPSELAFDYSIPDTVTELKPGCRVRVPLRNREATGTVLKTFEVDEDNATHSLKPFTSLIDPEPLVSATLMNLGAWIADYYGAPMEHVMRVILPESVRQDRHQEKTRKAVELTGPVDPEVLAEREKRAPKQAAILHALSAKGPLLAIADLGGSTALASAKALEKRGLVKLTDEAVRRDPEADETYVETQALQLNEEQSIALACLEKAIDAPSENKPILLHGVTGSGKTEVYLQAVDYCLKQGKSAIVLVPEIALAPQTVQRFKARFASIADQVAILHSHLSQGERFDEWHRIRQGKARVVIGARSAIFAPLANLGLIIVDEEHESSYKQETSPRYHGRDLAVLRGHMEPAAVVLGSATPALETFANHQSGKYDRVTLTQRVDAQSMPIIRVIDMKMEAQKHKGGDAILSERLRTAVENRLEKGEQVILFLNRRGFARSLQCGKCGYVCECTHCSLPLTYHRTDDRLICHLCGYQAIPPKKCPDCKDPGIRLQGYGTQKVEALLHKVFPDARMARIDADSARKKNALRDTLRSFKTQKVDILLGTQMIAKGLHFPNVTLVGILNADLGLHVPDFRAGERTFSLLTQVAGRAGRGELEGEVIVQTFTPHSPSVQFARHHDYEGYAEQELEFRQQFGFPPYQHIAVVTSRCTHERRAEFSLETLHRRLKESLPKGILLTEPMPSPLVRSHGQYRFQLTLRSPSARYISRYVQQTLAQLTLPEDVTLTLDVDAYSFS